MPQDAFTLRRLCRELNSLFIKGKINKIVQTSNETVVFWVYNGKGTEKLLLDVNPANPRIGVGIKEVVAPAVAPNFCMLLRKHLLNATIEEISLQGFDRIVKIRLTSSNEFFDAVEKTLYVELMGRYSNVILTENNKILGANRGVNFFDNGVRPLIVGKEYVFPPTQNRKLPENEGLKEYFKTTPNGKEKEYLLQGVQGLADCTAKEIIYRFCKDGKILSENPSLFYEFLNDFIYLNETRPCVSVSNGKVKDVFCFPYETIADEVIFFDNLYQAEEYYFNSKEREKKYGQKKTRLTTLINGAIKKVKRRLSNLSIKEKEALCLEENKIKGELILANLYRIKQGDKEIICENYYDGSRVEIELEENLSPSKNAERYYKKYSKQKRAKEIITPQKKEAIKELEYLESVLQEINLAEDIEELNKVSEELEVYGLVPQKKKVEKKEDVLPYRLYEVDGTTIKVGRNNLENDRLTASCRAEHFWFHAKEYHSSHVICETSKLSENLVKICAEICAYYSKGREGGKTEIVYTPKKNVKKPPKSALGFNTYDNYKSIIVNPDNHFELLKSDKGSVK